MHVTLLCELEQLVYGKGGRAWRDGNFWCSGCPKDWLCLAITWNRVQIGLPTSLSRVNCVLVLKIFYISVDEIARPYTRLALL
jgi:hypothetical protein